MCGDHEHARQGDPEVQEELPEALEGRGGRRPQRLGTLCNSPPFRKSESNIYAVRKDEPCTIKYVETADSHLILRPHNPAYSIEIIALEDGQKPGDHIVGRVCYVGIET